MREMNLKAYLLGTATETERTALDRSLLTDDDVFEQVLLAEDDLIEAYLQQQLAPSEQTQFEQFFLLDPEHQQKLRLAQALRRYANDPAKQKKKAAAAVSGWGTVFRRPVWQVAMASVLLVVAVISLKTYYTPTEAPRIAQGSPSPTTTIAPVTGTDVKAVELFPGQTRAINSDRIELAPNFGTVEFKLVLGKTTYANYAATLIADGEPGQPLPGQFQMQIVEKARVVLVRVPASRLERGGYSIKLDGITPQGNEEAARYSFTVKR